MLKLVLPGNFSIVFRSTDIVSSASLQKFAGKRTFAYTPIGGFPNPKLLLPNTYARVKSIKVETDTIKTMEFDVSSNEVFGFKSGQWLNVMTPKLENGVVPKNYSPENANVIPLSIMSTPNDLKRSNSVFLVVRKSQSPAITYLHDTAKVGDSIYLSDAKGDFYYSKDRYPDATSVVLIGGGIGVSPLISILRNIYETQMKVAPTFIQTAHTTEECLLRDSIKAMLHWRKDVKAYWILTQEKQPEQPTDFQKLVHYRSRMDKEYLAELPLNTSSLFFVCGPPGMVTMVEEFLNEKGVAKDNIKTEKWETGPI